MLRVLLYVAFAYGALAEIIGGAQWDAVRTGLDDFTDLPNAALIVGSVNDGRLFVAEKGTATVGSNYLTASFTKVYVGAIVMKLIQDGIMSLTDKPQDYLTWWTAVDERKDVTVQQLLSFTSGFVVTNASDESVTCVDVQNNSATTLEQCVKSIYENFFDYTPGSTYYYGSVHQQILGLMVEKATDKSWKTLFADILTTPTGMTKTAYFGQYNPRIAGEWLRPHTRTKNRTCVHIFMYAYM